MRLEQQLSSPRAIETLAQAQRLWPGADPVFVVGSDLVTQIPRWYQAQQLLGQCRLAVVPRQGWPLQETDLDQLRQLGGRVELLPLQIPASASSQIRHHPSPELVPPALWPELMKHNLYGAGPLDPNSTSPTDQGSGRLTSPAATPPPPQPSVEAPLQPSPIPQPRP